MEVEHRLEKLPIALRRRRARPRVLGRRHGGAQFFPHRIAEDFSHGIFGHPEFPSWSF